jgi:hypothetical protein
VTRHSPARAEALLTWAARPLCSRPLATVHTSLIFCPDLGSEVPMRRAPWIVLVALLGGVAGCVPLFYAYPAVSFVPAVNVGKTHEKTYAFRVDIADHRSGKEGKTGHYVLRQLHVAKSGFVAGQANLALDSGYYWNCFVKCFSEQTNHTIRLRFYRPGYHLVEVQSWQTDGGLVWHEAPTPEARERTLDRLLGPADRSAQAHREASEPEQTWGFDRLAAGSASPEHRCALLFAAAEYERLSATASLEDKVNLSHRCSAKAKWLRDRADR